MANIQIEIKSLENWLSIHYPTILSEYKTMGGMSFMVSGLVLSEDGTEAIVNGVPIRLSGKESALLRVLWNASGRAVSKKEIYEGISGGHYMADIDDGMIKIIVYRLRKKVEPDPAKPVFIKSVRGFGWILDR